jgi:SP family sugar:H+ symporter-like MFS transporter
MTENDYLVLYQLMIISGIFLSYLIDWGTHGLSGSASWRVNSFFWLPLLPEELTSLRSQIPVGMQMLWGLILCIGICSLFTPAPSFKFQFRANFSAIPSNLVLLPESPRHLIYKDRMVDARAAIAQMNESTADSALVDDIVAELLEGIQEENEGGKATWAECFSPSVRMRTINGMMSA